MRLTFAIFALSSPVPASRSSIGALALALATLLAALPAFAQQPRVSEIEDYRDLWKRGAYKEAEQELRGMLESQKGFVRVDYHYDHAKLLMATGQVDEAIEVMEQVADRAPYPAYYLELALMYKYRGRLEQYEKHLRLAANLTRNGRWTYSSRDENLVAMGRIAELLGENPHTILNTHYNFLLDENPKMVGAHIGAAELGLRHAGYDIASEHFQAALAIEPENQEALAGLAETYWEAGDDRLEETLQKLEAINPNHPRARAIRVERLLDRKNTREATELIDNALEINPISHRFRAFKAAVFYLEDDTRRMEDMLQEILLFNPFESAAYSTVGRFASRHYRFKDGAAFQKKALEVDPLDHKARALYTLDLMRLGREFEGRAELERAFELHPFNVQMNNLLKLMATLETFDTIERDGITLRLPAHEAPVVAEDALGLLQKAMTQYEELYDVEIEKPVLVEMFDNHDDFMVRSVGLPGSVGHLGICFGQLVTLDSPSARPRGSWNWRSVLWHEFVHVITLQKTNNRMPRWLSEGISVYEEERYSPAWEDKLDPDYRAIVQEDGLPDLEALNALFTAPQSPVHLLFGYFAAGEFVEYYIDAHGMPALVAALDAIGDGADAEIALAEAAEVSTDEIADRFRDHMEARTKPFENLPKLVKAGDDAHPVARLFRNQDDQEAEVETPSSPFTDAMKRGEEALKAKDWDAAIKAFEQAYELYPDYQGQGAPLPRIAAIYQEMGNEEKYREALRRVAYSAPEALEPAARLAMLEHEDQNWEEAAELAEWAIGIDPYDVNLRTIQADAWLHLDRPRDALDALATLAYLEPLRATEHRLRRAHVLKDVGEPAEAKNEVLRVLEDVPHFWDAQELLLNLVDTAAADETEVSDQDTTVTESGD